METRQDTTENELRSLSAVVSRVELNQQHSLDLAKLRFDSLDTGTATIAATLDRFMGRINAIVSGEVSLPQNERLMSDFRKWQDDVNDQLDALDPTLQSRVRTLEDRALRGQGVVEVFGSTKTLLLIIAAFLGPIIGLIALVSR